MRDPPEIANIHQHTQCVYSGNPNIQQIARSVSFLLLAFDYVWQIMYPSFPLVDMIHRGDEVNNVIGVQKVPDIAQNESSGDLRPVAYRSYCVGGQYLTSYMSL